MRLPIVSLGLALALLTSCARESDVIGNARRHLRNAPCEADVAVAGAAGVNNDPHLV